MIITDYWMPEMTGYELLKIVKVRRIDLIPTRKNTRFISDY